MKNFFPSTTAFIAFLASCAAPFLATAATVPTGINTSVIASYSTGIVYVINGILVPVLMALALIVFLWGVYKYFILGADNDTERETGRQFVFWGLIGFVIILSVWGLVAIVGNTLGLSPGGSAPPIPRL